MFEVTTDRTRRVITLAVHEAHALNHGSIGTQHLLLGLICEGESVAVKALASLGISFKQVRASVVEATAPGTADPAEHLPFTPRAKKVIELSPRQAHQLGEPYVAPEHLLLALIEEEAGMGARILTELGASPSQIRKKILEHLQRTGPEEEETRTS